MEYIFSHFYEKFHYIHDIVNWKNRKKLHNKDFTIISSNCAGGILYHWLGLRFNSPFINLWLKNDDYIKVLENMDAFLSTPIVEYNTTEVDYPVGIGWDGIKIYFMHYKTYDEAINKWRARVKRINKDNMCVLLTNWGGKKEILDRFERLPYKNKLVFVNRRFSEYKSSVYLRGFEKCNGVWLIWKTKNILGKRYIDEFDYVQYFNNLKGGCK